MDDGFEVLEVGNDYCFRLSREARERTCNLFPDLPLTYTVLVQTHSKY